MGVMSIEVYVRDVIERRFEKVKNGHIPYTTLLKEPSVELAPILTILFNKSVTTGIVPSD